MFPARTIRSPRDFVVEPYTPGLTIDFREDEPSRGPRAPELDAAPDASVGQLAAAADDLCRRRGITDREGDLQDSLRRFGETDDLAAALTAAVRRLAPEVANATPRKQLDALLEVTGTTRTAALHPSRLYCHRPDHPTDLEGDATHFGYADGDDLSLVASGRRYPLHAHSYFCVPGEGRIEGPGRALVISRFGVRGLFCLGGSIEPWGRLRYIDGCTDTLLVAPPRRGDPCLNALYFPPGTAQTEHTHPSLRAGMVLSGEGTCVTPNGNHLLSPGRVFFLPPETRHAFHTAPQPDGDRGPRAALTVLAFHPDSDAGPSDEDHPMLNRTYFRLLHRLRSAARTAS